MVKRLSLEEGWGFLTDLKWQAKLFAYDAQYGVSDGYLTVKEAEKADKEFHEIMDKWIPKVEAEICLAEIEIDNTPDIKEYDSILNGNAFRTSKRAQRRKQNIHHHKADRKHGKPVPQSDKEYWDGQSGTFYRWDEKKKTFFHSHKKPVVHRNRKTFRNRLEAAMDAREQDYILSPDPIEELWNAYWLYCDAECRLNHKADEPLYLHRTQGAYEEAIKEWEKLSEEANNAFLEVNSLLYALGLNWGYFED